MRNQEDLEFSGQNNRIFETAGKDIYYPGQEGLEHYRSELRKKKQEKQNYTQAQVIEYIGLDTEELTEEQAKQRCNEIKDTLVNNHQQQITKSYEINLHNFIEEQSKKIIDYIERPCVKLAVYLLALGYKTVGSNAFGSGFEKGVWFTHNQETLCATFSGQVFRGTPITSHYLKSDYKKEELSQKEIAELGLDFTGLQPNSEDYTTSHIEKNDLEKIIKEIEKKVADQNSQNLATIPQSNP